MKHYISLLTMNVSWISFNLLWLQEAVFRAADQLKTPTLVHSDSTYTWHMDTIIKALAAHHPIIVTTAENRPSPGHYQIPQSTILLGNNADVLFQSLRGFHLWRARNPTIAFFPAGQQAQDWLSAGWRYTRSVSMAAAAIEDPIRFYTWFPYRYPECNNVTTIMKLSPSVLFPRKIFGNLQGCPLYGVMTELPPLAQNFTHGIESSMVQAIAKTVNLTLTRAYLPVGQIAWLQVLRGEPVNGMKLLWENKADIMFSYQILRQDAAQYGDYIRWHTQDAWAWFVPGPLPLSRALSIFKAFTTDLWMLFGSCFIVQQLASALLHLYTSESIIDSITRIYSINLYQGTNWLNTNKFRTFLILAYVYALNITSAYQSSLINFLSTIPREAAVTNFEELVKSDFQIFYHEALNEFIEVTASEDPLMAKLKVQKRLHSMPAVGKGLKLVTRDRKALVVPHLKCALEININEGNEFYDEFGGPKVLVLKDVLSVTYFTIYFSQGHPLVPIFEKLEQFMIETGFLGYFLAMATASRSPTQPSLFEKTPFTLQNVEGGFYLLGVSLVLCNLIFLAEFFHAEIESNPPTLVKC